MVVTPVPVRSARVMLEGSSRMTPLLMKLPASDSVASLAGLQGAGVGHGDDGGRVLAPVRVQVAPASMLRSELKPVNWTPRPESVPDAMAEVSSRVLVAVPLAVSPPLTWPTNAAPGSTISRLV